MITTNGTSSEVDELASKYNDIDPFLISKWERIFTTFFDRNCSHNVDWGDFYLVVRKVREVYGAESMQISYARKSLEALWKGLCQIADGDRDELISLDEWVQLLRKAILKKEDKSSWFDEYQTFMFQLFDVSGDGVLDQAEYADGMSIYGFKYMSCMNNFKQFAFDAQGHELNSITPVQWKNLFMDLFFSSDKLRPGNLLFGHSIFDKPAPTSVKPPEKPTPAPEKPVDKPDPACEKPSKQSAAASDKSAPASKKSPDKPAPMSKKSLNESAPASGKPLDESVASDKPLGKPASDSTKSVDKHASGKSSDKSSDKPALASGKSTPSSDKSSNKSASASSKSRKKPTSTSGKSLNKPAPASGKSLDKPSPPEANGKKPIAKVVKASSKK